MKDFFILKKLYRLLNAYKVIRERLFRTEKEFLSREYYLAELDSVNIEIARLQNEIGGYY